MQILASRSEGSRSETCSDGTGQIVSGALRVIADGMYLEVSQLREMLAAAFKLAGKRLNLLMNNLVSAHVAALCEPFTAHLAGIRAFAGMSTLVSLGSIRTMFRDSLGTHSLTFKFPS